MDGVRVVELAGLAPSPFATMMLSDMGAEVLRIDRPVSELSAPFPLSRGRESIVVDLKARGADQLVLRLVASADVLIESNRPGVTERLGIGPEACHEVNPGLIYGRMTGWGQDGPRAHQAGHDINYIATAGALHAIGRAGERPVPPINLVGDFGGGGMLLAFGVLAALFERSRTGLGQVVDAAMLDGSALLLAGQHGMLADDEWSDERGVNLTDGGAPFYDTYETSDGRYVAVGALEAKFYDSLIRGLGLDPDGLPAQHDRAGWPRLRSALSEAFASRTRDEWATVFADSDACVSPVLSLREAIDDPHVRARSTFVDVDGIPQPAPAPRFSRTPSAVRNGAPRVGEHTMTALSRWGFSADDIAALRDSGVLRHANPDTCA
nr:CaiB/BaiF CoA-transferase family protein [Gordonia jinghuaiqii]